MSWKTYGLLAGFLFIAAGRAPADVVMLSDGTRLVGRIESMNEERLIVHTTFAGRVKIDPALVTSVQTDETVHVALTSGDRLVGPMETTPDGQTAMVHTQMGGIPIEMQKVVAIWPPGGRSPEQRAAEKEIAEVQKDAEARIGKWSATLEAGLFYTEGNSEQFNARGRLDVARKSSVDELRFWAGGEFAEQSDIRNTAEARAGAYYEHLIGDKWFLYGSNEAEFDEFENLDLRYTLTVGAGYYWWKQEKKELKTRAGASFLHESFMDGFTRDSAQGELAVDLRWDLNSWLQVVHNTTWYPTFEELRDYRLVSDSAFLLPLASSDIWKLKLGARYEYDPIPNPGFERLDQTYYANVVVELKE